MIISDGITRRVSSEAFLVTKYTIMDNIFETNFSFQMK